MAKIIAEMDSNYRKEIKLDNLKRVFRKENGDWAFETLGGEFGTTSKNGFKKIVKKKPEIIEQPAPYNGLIEWLMTRTDETDSEIEFNYESFCESLNGLTESEVSEIINTRIEGFVRQRNKTGLASQEWEKQLLDVMKKINSESESEFIFDDIDTEE